MSTPDTDKLQQLGAALQNEHRLERRIAELEKEVERLTKELRQWQEPVDNTGDYVHPLWKKVHGAEWDRDRAREKLTAAEQRIEKLTEALRTARRHCVLWQGEPHEHSCAIHAAVVAQIDAALSNSEREGGNE